LSFQNITPRRAKKLNYNIEKLYSLSKTMLPHYHKLLLRLNKSVCHDDFKLITYLYFDQEGLPKGRPYSYFCSTLNDNKKHKKVDYSFETRKQFLNAIGLDDYYEVYDIKSEIPRINYLFHTGEWKNDKYDFYAEIIKEYGKAIGDKTALDRGETKFTEYNDSMKQLFMRIYFGKGTDKQSFNGYNKDKLKRVNKTKDYNGLSDLDFFKYALNVGYEVMYKDWKTLCNITREICKPSLGPLIFWYSFFIETEVKIELLKRGKKVYNVYDGFYYNQDISEEIKDILKDKALYVYNKYMKPIKKSNVK
jgi:hypothetical protein